MTEPPPAQPPPAMPPHQPGAPRRGRGIGSAICIMLLLAAASLALLATAPVDGDFWWPDAPRHALNGLFLRDFIAAHPWHDPMGWAVAYYLHRPGLTILFYPPLFYGVEAVAFALFGFSHLVAQACVTLFVLLLGGSTYWLARSYLPQWSALGAALLAVGMPEAALWGRQVMLDVPAYALAVAGACFLVGYSRSGRPLLIYLAALFVVGAIYTKYNSGFVVPVFAIALLAERGPRILRERHVLIASALAAVLLAPAGLLMMKFGGGNLAAVEGLSGTLPLNSLACWLFYLKALPAQLGAATLILALCGLAVLVRQLHSSENWRGLVLLPAWLAVGYLAFSFISVKEPRHAMMALLPLAITAPLFLRAMLPGRIGELAGLALGAGSLVYSLAWAPVPRVSGYRAVADYLAKAVPPNGIVVFSGYRDGNLLFNLAAHGDRLAAHGDRPDIAVVRADKLLLSVPAGERRRGVIEANVDEARIANQLRGLGAVYFVEQPGFWSDLPVMARFAHVIEGPDYRPVAQFGLSGTVSTQDAPYVVDILQPAYPVAKHPAAINVDIPLAGQRFEGETSGAR